MNTIKLFGIDGREYKMLKARLHKVLQQLNINPSIEEINDIESILDHKLSSVPALMLGNNELAVAGAMPKMSEIKQYVQNYIKENNKMKKILVPIDFSDTAHNAYRFARAMAVNLNAEIQVVHAYAGMIRTDEMLVVESFKSREEVLMNRLKAFCDYVPEDGSVMTEVNVTYDAIHTMNPANKIIKLSEEADIIVMGASGSHDIIDKFLGSMSSKVAQKAECPVLLVPKDVEFNGLDRILYASNWESVQPEFINRIVNFGEYFGSSFDFVHIDERSERDDYEEMEETLLKEIFEDREPTFRFSLLRNEGLSPIQGLYKFADQNEIDLIVLVNRQDSFWENMMGRSVTKEMAIKAKYPILVYHIEQA